MRLTFKSLMLAACLAPAPLTALAADNDPIYFRDAPGAAKTEYYRLVQGQFVPLGLPQPVVEFLGAVPGNETKGLVSVSMTPGAVDQTPYLAEMRNRSVTLRAQSNESYAVECDRSVEGVLWSYGQLLATCTLTAKFGTVLWDEDAFAAVKPQLAALLPTTVSFGLVGKANRQITIPPVTLTVAVNVGKAVAYAGDELRRQWLGTATERGIETTEAVAQAALVHVIGLDFCGAIIGGRWEWFQSAASGHLAESNWKKYNDVLFSGVETQRSVCTQIATGDEGGARYRLLRDQLYQAAVNAAVHRDGDALWLADDGGRAEATVELKPAGTRVETGDEVRDTAYVATGFLFKQ